MDRGRQEPLYRRVNTKARGVSHGGGGEYRWSRHVRQEDRQSRGAMGGEKRHGLDYTPLFRFLLSRVGEEWSRVEREALARLDRPDPIYWMVARSPEERKSLVRIGESTYYSGLYVDEAGRLRKVDPYLRVEDMEPSCSCCTHTFNGVRFTRPYREGERVILSG